MKYSPLVSQLIKALTCLPGVGNKSAQRMAFHLLERNREGALDLSRALHDAMEHVRHCERCRNFTESKLCEICIDPKRSQSGLLCIVESPQDVVAVEQTAEYRGSYFVLMGRLSPLDGIGPADIGLDKLSGILEEEDIQEVILATNFTIEGEATAHYITDMCRSKGIVTSRLAQGVPIGGELEHVDGTTLGRALASRSQI